MAIESLISDLIAALTANTEALEAHTALLKGGITKKKAAPDDSEPESDETDAPKNKKKKVVKEDKNEKKTRKKASLTLDDVKEAYGEYLAVKDKEELANRKSNVGSILASFKVKQVRDLQEENFEEAMELLKEYVDQIEEENEDDSNDDQSESLI